MTKTSELTAYYWDTRYQEKRTGWDIGYHNSLHTDYIEKNYTQEACILVPGAGSAYEVEYLWQRGFKNVYACDYAPMPKELFIKRVPHFPESQYLSGDFFQVTQKFDVVLEQTFFCAIDPKLREKYVEHMHSILKPKGIIFGVFFEMHKPDGPPFGGSASEYKQLFSSKFEIATMKPSVESIPQRMGSELIVEFIKK